VPAADMWHLPDGLARTTTTPPDSLLKPSSDIGYVALLVPDTRLPSLRAWSPRHVPRMGHAGSFGGSVSRPVVAPTAREHHELLRFEPPDSTPGSEDHRQRHCRYAT